MQMVGRLSWISAFMVLLFAIGVWWTFQEERRSRGELGELIYERMAQEDAGSAELCEQAKRVEQRFIEERNARKADAWAAKRQWECLDAAVCGITAAGCDEARVSPAGIPAR